ncbi:MAG: ornithine carbamoyltransferase [Promethearchaeota archaeon]
MKKIEHLLSILDLTEDQIYALLDLAIMVKEKPQKYSTLLQGKCLALLFQKTSTRTRTSFQNGMYQLGGNAIYLDWRTTNLHLGALSDEIKCLTSYVDLLVARVHEHETLETIKRASKVPVINGLSNKFHPCQVLSDLFTIKELMGSFDEVHLAYIGDGNNVCNSLILGCTMVGIHISVANPKGYKPAPDVIKWVYKQKKSKFLSLHEDPKEAIKDADFIYSDTFVSMGQEAEADVRLNVFKAYQLNKELLHHTRKNPLIMHCLPAHREIEITSEVLDSKNSIVFEQAKNRLFLQKALLLTLLSEN